MSNADSNNPPQPPGQLKIQPPLFSRVYYATTISAIQGVQRSAAWYKGWQDYFYPPKDQPNIIKNYDVREHLPVRIFFPTTYDQTSPQTLPTLFTIHGGGFSLGSPDDDDLWNRSFADLHNVLVIALNYSKAPSAPFLIGIYDIEALYIAVIDDESLPIDRSRVAVGGFSAGGNLSLALCQLPSIHSHPRAAPKAVVPIYPPLDFSIESGTKRGRRPYKTGLSGIRGENRDYVLNIADVLDWAYVPYGTSLADPLLSPFFADRASLPAHVCVIAAELDYLAFEAWQFASKLAGREAPKVEMAGRQENARTQELEIHDERFWFESKETGVKWMLVPDVIHSFDLHAVGKMVSDPETARDGDAKALKVMKVLGDWLFVTAWKT